MVGQFAHLRTLEEPKAGPGREEVGRRSSMTVVLVAGLITMLSNSN